MDICVSLFVHQSVQMWPIRICVHVYVCVYVLPSQDANQKTRPIIYLKFYTGDPPQAKRIWKNAVEQHTFFRLVICIVINYGKIGTFYDILSVSRNKRHKRADINVNFRIACGWGRGCFEKPSTTSQPNVGASITIVHACIANHVSVTSEH